MKKTLKSILKYIGAILISILIAIFLRLFLIDFYSIPSDSMYPCIEPGDFIKVNKMYVGARFYKNFDFLDGARIETFRTPGYSKLKRNDVTVFNHFIYEQKVGWDMDPSIFYVKRCIGLPGDTLSIINGYYTINGETGFGNINDQKRLSQHKGDYAPGIYYAFPFHSSYNWNIRNFGPLIIPKAGQTMQIDSLNILLYSKMITYEVQKNNSIVEVNSWDYINKEYTFTTNWYFMAGDKIYDSRDSRYIGLIPEEFIVGKASFVLYSKDPYTNKFVWKRMFKRLK